MAQIVFLEARASVPVVDYLADQRCRIDAGLPHDPIAVVLQVAEDAAEEAEHVDMYRDALSELGVEPNRGENYEDAVKRRAEEIDDRDYALCDAIRDGFDVEIESRDTPDEIWKAISDRAEKLKAWTKALVKGLETFGVDVDDGGEDIDYAETAIAEGSARYEAMRNALDRYHGIDVTDRTPKEIADAIASLTTKPKTGDLDATANDTSAAEIEAPKATIDAAREGALAEGRTRIDALEKEIASHKQAIVNDAAALATLRATIANLETKLAEEKRARAAARTAGYSDSTSEIATLRAYVKALENQVGRLTIGMFRVAETKIKAERIEAAKRIANEGAEK